MFNCSSRNNKILQNRRKTYQTINTCVTAIQLLCHMKCRALFTFYPLLQFYLYNIAKGNRCNLQLINTSAAGTYLPAASAFLQGTYISIIGCN